MLCWLGWVRTAFQHLLCTPRHQGWRLENPKHFKYTRNEALTEILYYAGCTCAISWRMRGKSSSGCSSQSSSALTGFPGLEPVRPLCRVSIVSCQQKCSCRRSQPGSWPRHTASNNTLIRVSFELLVVLQKSDAEVSCSNKSRVLLPAAAISKLILTLGRPGPWSRTSTSTAQEATLHTEVLLRARRRVWSLEFSSSKFPPRPPAATCQYFFDTESGSVKGSV